jgi:pimeloyl-ACP methyl ester carboxylesterase
MGQLMIGALMSFALPWVLAATEISSVFANDGMLEFPDYRLEYRCRGEGTPVVFLESPSGLSAAEAFAPVFDDMAERTRVCRLERLGFGNSDRPIPGLVQTASDYADELHRLVSRAAPEGDIVIVGYSFGGFIARVYADRHPERVAGLLLIDAAHEKVFRAMKHRFSARDWARLQEVFDWFLDNLGHDAWTSQFEVSRARIDPELPVVVVSRGLDHQRLRLTGMSEDAFRLANDLHDHYQRDLGNLTRNTTRIVARKSEHLIVESQPRLVLDALDQLLRAVRAGRE